MHIPDGYLGPYTYGGLWAAMFGVWSYAARKLKKDLPVSQAPHLAMASAFSFVAMIFTVPLPGGTTGHITGAVLIAILIGPWAAVVAVSVSLLIQAFIFGDGGVTALSANCFNIALVSSFVGYALYRLVTGLGGLLVKGRNTRPGDGGFPSQPWQVFGTAIGAYGGVNAAAFFTALELGLQPLIYGGSPTGAGYFPYSLKVAFPAIMIPHLTLVGGLEALVAALVVTFLRRGTNAILQLPKAAVPLFFAFFFILPSTGAGAHDFLIEPRGGEFLVVFGHGTQREEFAVSKVKQVRAVDLQGKELPVQREKKEKGLALKMTGRPAVVLATVDNGYWSKTIYGWKELPKRKASRVVEAIHSLFFSKTILSWSEAVQAAAVHADLDIIPLSNPLEKKAGDSLSVKILLRGQPLPGAEVIGGEHANLGKTDQEGLIRVSLVRGQNLLTVENKAPLQDDPDADKLTLTATLTFEVKQ
ncbi:MAG: cobalt transporter CbiM [Deltaproteobacteria bacterium]|nr:cobalt transporter CbiM [Deltaproteobacteria bacterium]